MLTVDQMFQKAKDTCQYEDQLATMALARRIFDSFPDTHMDDARPTMRELFDPLNERMPMPDIAEHARIIGALDVVYSVLVARVLQRVDPLRGEHRECMALAARHMVDGHTDRLREGVKNLLDLPEIIRAGISVGSIVDLISTLKGK